MQLYLFRVLVGIFYVDIYQQMSTKKTPKSTRKMPKNAKNYYCEICDVTSNKLSEYKRHLDTKKHKSTEKPFMPGKSIETVMDGFIKLFKEISLII